MFELSQRIAVRIRRVRYLGNVDSTVHLLSRVQIEVLNFTIYKSNMLSVTEEIQSLNHEIISASLKLKN